MSAVREALAELVRREVFDVRAEPGGVVLLAVPASAVRSEARIELLPHPGGLMLRGRF